MIKKLFFPALLACAFPAFAQSNLSLGGGLDYNVDVKRTGIFLRGTYDIDESWRGAATFNLFLDSGSRTTQWEVAADAHYFFWSDEVKMSSYLIGGLNLYHRHRSTPALDEDTGGPLPSSSSTTNHFGINLGAGFQTELSPKLVPFAEAKVSVGNGSLFGISAGLLIRLQAP